LFRVRASGWTCTRFQWLRTRGISHLRMLVGRVCSRRFPAHGFRPSGCDSVCSISHRVDTWNMCRLSDLERSGWKPAPRLSRTIAPSSHGVGRREDARKERSLPRHPQFNVAFVDPLAEARLSDPTFFGAYTDCFRASGATRSSPTGWRQGSRSPGGHSHCNLYVTPARAAVTQGYSRPADTHARSAHRFSDTSDRGAA
jgi:hypothetical protein